MNNEIVSTLIGIVNAVRETICGVFRSSATNSEMLTAMIGVCGTLAGTVLGWLLNSLSNRGKLQIFVCSWKDEFIYNDMGCMVPSSSAEQTECYSFKTSLEVYNSSGESKIMRNIEIVFSDGKKDVRHDLPDDQETMRHGNGLVRFDKLEPVNIPPKTVIKLNLRDGVCKKDGSLDFLWQSKRVYLQYKDKNNRRKRILIKKENYAEYFANHVQDTKAT